jgi:hypothetical protein
MVYRFSKRDPGSQKTSELQLKAPVGTPIEKLKLALCASPSEMDTIEYLGPIEDADVEGPVVLVKEIDSPSALSEELPTPTILGWYSPIGNAQANNKCVVDGCHRHATYHLCEQHGVPGLAMEINGDGFVVSSWFVERGGQMRIIPLNDYALGDLFGGRQAFEDRLGAQSYKVHRLISSHEEMEATKKQYPGLRATIWSPNLPDGKDGQ